ncbi:MAG: DNA-directed RNA polymerase subunit omega [Turicibacter sp.]|nr:DNA-directed RNA polymerase subunit omega [Turicibacter sp.]
MSMRYPSIDNLLEKVDSKYKIAYISAKRARQIVDEGQSQLDFVDDLPTAKSVKPVGIALEEILYDVVDFKLDEL